MPLELLFRTAFLTLFDFAPHPTDSTSVQLLKVMTGTSESLLPRYSFRAPRNLIFFLILPGVLPLVVKLRVGGGGTLPVHLSSLHICRTSAVGLIYVVNFVVQSPSCPLERIVSVYWQHGHHCFNRVEGPEGKLFAFKFFSFRIYIMQCNANECSMNVYLPKGEIEW